MTERSPHVPGVVRYDHECGGAWAIEGTRVRTGAMRELYTHDYTMLQIQAEFPALTLKQIGLALCHEIMMEAEDAKLD